LQINGISHLADDILFWKKKYCSIYYLKISDNIYIFRALTRGEYIGILTLRDNGVIDGENIIIDNSLLYKSNDNSLDSVLAGEIEYLLECIIVASGFAEDKKFEQDLAVERNNISLLNNQITLLICKAFPQLTPRGLDDLDYPTLLHYLALAENILDVKLDVQKQQETKTIDFEKENQMLIGNKKIPITRQPPRGATS